MATQKGGLAHPPIAVFIATISSAATQRLSGVKQGKFESSVWAKFAVSAFHTLRQNVLGLATSMGAPLLVRGLPAGRTEGARTATSRPWRRSWGSKLLRALSCPRFSSRIRRFRGVFGHVFGVTWRADRADDRFFNTLWPSRKVICRTSGVVASSSDLRIFDWLRVSRRPSSQHCSGLPRSSQLLSFGHSITIPCKIGRPNGFGT
jgi:hypothetical protein